jgi:hypothetical protein
MPFILLSRTKVSSARRAKVVQGERKTKKFFEFFRAAAYLRPQAKDTNK